MEIKLHKSPLNVPIPTNASDSDFTTDPYNLNRFLQAQEESFERALSEIRGGSKRSHWMWYIFPQFEGLAFSETSQIYAIKSIEEARAYLAHPLLGTRLIECAQAALEVEDKSALKIFGSPDDLKLRSCATLFALVSSPDSVFERLLERYFDGEPDEQTRELLGMDEQTEPQS